MIFFGYGIVTSTDYRDSDLVFRTREEAEKYIALRDTYFFKHNSQIVELYYLPVDPLAKL